MMSYGPHGRHGLGAVDVRHLMTASFKTICPAIVTLAMISAVPLAADGNDIAAGYQHLTVSSGGDAQAMPLGFGVEFSHVIRMPWSIVGIVDWSHKSGLEGEFAEDDTRSTLSLLSFGTGPRWSKSVINRTLFAQVLAGATRQSASANVAGVPLEGFSETRFMLQPGAGVVFWLDDVWGVVGEGDYRRVFTDGLGTNVFRFFGGVRLKLN